jgi:hypothetical protein
MKSTSSPKTTRLVDGVEGFGLFAGHADALLGNDPQSRFLDQRVDRARQIARGRVGLDNRKGAFNRHNLVLGKRWWELRRLYRRRPGTASDQAKCLGGRPAIRRQSKLQQFHEYEPSLKPASRFRSRSPS